MQKKKVLIAFLGNINYDTRSFNLFNSFKEQQYDIEFIGFDWLTENFKSTKGQITIYKLTKKFPSILFYIRFYFILTAFLIKKKYDVVFAEDLYCLPPCVIIGKIKKTKVIYDCRELFGFLAGLKDKKFVQKLWSFIEKIFISKADIVITTGKMDSDFLVSKFDLENLIVIRNLPMFKKTTAPFNYYDKLKIIPSKKILLYQGVVVHGRGIRLIFKVLQLTDEFVLIILGDGEHLYHYKNLAEEMKISDRVFFIGKVSQQDLSNYTAGAFAGLSLIENLSLSYYYALPNKLFEYIMAEVPVVVTDLPQMKEIVELYKVGIVTNENDIELLKNELENLTKNDYHYSELKNNCKIASEELCWEREFKFLSQRVQSFFS